MFDDFDRLHFAASYNIIPHTQKPQLKHDKQLDIKNCLKQQIYYEKQKVEQLAQYYFKTKPVTLKQKDIQLIKEGTIQPCFNAEFHNYLPQPLENQFVYRFHDHKFIYSNNNHLLNELQLKIYDKNTDQFTTDKADNFSKYQNDNNIRLLANQEKEKVVVILHDFYQHPIILQQFFNCLLEADYQIIIPFLNDIINIVSYEGSDYEQQRLCVQRLQQVIEKITGLQPYRVIAHGTAANFAISLQNKSPYQCKQIILCSPCINNVKIVKAHHHHQPHNFDNLSQFKEQQVISDSSFDHSEYSITHIEDENETNNSSKMFKKHHKKHKNQEQHDNQINIETDEDSEMIEASISRRVAIGRTNRSSLANTSYSTQNNRTSEWSAPENIMPHIEENKRHASILPSLQLKMMLIDIQQEIEETNDILIAINDAIYELFQDEELISLLMQLYDTQQVEKFKLLTSLEKFLKMYRPLKQLKKMQQKFIKYLYSILVLSPLENILRYRQNLHLYDKKYFEMINELNYYFKKSTVEVTTTQNAILLVGSHDLLMSTYIENVNIINNNFPNIHSRLLYGCAHDIFATCPDVILRLLQ